VNYLFNPLHPHANGVEIECCKSIKYDKRLFTYARRRDERSMRSSSLSPLSVEAKRSEVYSAFLIPSEAESLLCHIFCFVRASQSIFNLPQDFLSISDRFPGQ
jgi:hypothetical protein